MTLDDFLQAAWRDHADHTDIVAQRLAASLDLPATPQELPRFVGLLTHVYGEHLGQWSEGVALLDDLAHRSCAADDPALGAIRRGRAMLRLAGGDATSIDGLDDADATCAMALAADALAARGGIDRAITLHAQARARAPESMDGHAAVRALAISGNNLSAVFESRAEALSAHESDAMVHAAEAGLRWWGLAGGWLEEERAEYQLARCLLRAGRHDDARRHIERCIQICDANDAPAFERFFGHAVLALAHRAQGDAAGSAAQRERALEQLERVPQDERAWCDRERKELAA